MAHESLARRVTSARLLLIVSSTLAACHGNGVREEQPAWIASASPQTHAELVRAIRSVLGEREVRLADDALTRSHRLVLEPAARPQLAGRVTGRNLELPERFELVIAGRGCYLAHVGSAERVRLRGVDCVPAQL